MKTLCSLALLLTALALAGCSTSPSDRVSKKQALFDSWPAEVRENLKAGKVGIGYTPDQVWVALGEADRKYTRTTEKGTQEIWAYLSHAPAFSIGIGLGGGSMGGGVAVSSRGDHDDELRRIVFANGVVAAIEETKSK